MLRFILSKIPRDWESINGGIGFELPVSITLFYFSAISFVIANSIYVFIRPEIIKKYNDFGDFRNKGLGEKYLKTYVTNNLISRLKPEELKKYATGKFNSELVGRQLIDYGKDTWGSKINNRGLLSRENNYGLFYLGASLDKNISIENMIEEYVIGEINQDRLQNYFWDAYKFERYLSQRARWLCLMFYLLGLILILAVSIGNLVYVLTTISI